MSYYDRADWHYGGDFPESLPDENGATHIGMFFGWAIKRGLADDSILVDDAEGAAAVRDGECSGRDLFIQCCDEKLSNECLNDEGNRFAEAYYRSRYIEDYGDCFGSEVDTLYHVEDSAANHCRIEVLLDQRFAEWRDECHLIDQQRGVGASHGGLSRFKSGVVLACVGGVIVFACSAVVAGWKIGAITASGFWVLGMWAAVLQGKAGPPDDGDSVDSWADDDVDGA